jgi:acyl-coenzyme A synthetase/AMP-(fatty) acid ligase
MANLPELVIAYHACFRAGVIAAPLISECEWLDQQAETKNRTARAQSYAEVRKDLGLKAGPTAEGIRKPESRILSKENSNSQIKTYANYV